MNRLDEQPIQHMCSKKNCHVWEKSWV